MSLPTWVTANHLHSYHKKIPEMVSKCLCFIQCDWTIESSLVLWGGTQHKAMCDTAKENQYVYKTEGFSSEKRSKIMSNLGESPGWQWCTCMSKSQKPWGCYNSSLRCILSEKQLWNVFAQRKYGYFIFCFWWKMAKVLWYLPSGVRDTGRNSCYDLTLLKSSPEYITSLWSSLTGHRPPVRLSWVRLNTLLIHQTELSELTADTQTKNSENLGFMRASPARQALAISVSFPLSHDTAFSVVSSF